jgi:nucleotide-binding universal stress UspA family protein
MTRLEGYARSAPSRVGCTSVPGTGTTRVTIVEACGPDDEKTALDRLNDVARYLSHHRIKCGPKIMLEQKGSGAEQLIRSAQEEHADLLVTGAYGHSRLGEWIFGGMTRELLAASPICCLMSH